MLYTQAQAFDWHLRPLTPAPSDLGRLLSWPLRLRPGQLRPRKKRSSGLSLGLLRLPGGQIVCSRGSGFSTKCVPGTGAERFCKLACLRGERKDSVNWPVFGERVELAPREPNSSLGGVPRTVGDHRGSLPPQPHSRGPSGSTSRLVFRRSRVQPWGRRPCRARLYGPLKGKT